MQRRKVDLPEPDDPRIATTSCSCAVSEMPLSTAWLPKVLQIDLTSSATGAAAGVPSMTVTCASSSFRTPDRHPALSGASPRRMLLSSV